MDEKGAMLMFALGVAKCEQGDLLGASESFEDARRLRQANGTLETEAGAQLLHEIGDVKRLQGDFLGASESYEDARRLRQANGTLETEAGAQLLHEIGSVKRLQGDFLGASESYEDARRLRQANGTLETEAGAVLLFWLGLVKRLQGDFPGASESYEDARRLRQAAGTLETEAGAVLLFWLGLVKRLQGDLLGASESYEDARRHRQAAGILETEAGAELLHEIGNVKRLQGDFFGASESFEDARRSRQAAGILETEAGAVLLHEIGNVKRLQDDLVGALASFEDARRIMEVLGTIDTEDGAQVLRGIETIMRLRLSSGNLVVRALADLDGILAERRVNALKQLGLVAQSEPDLVAPHLEVIVNKLGDADVRVRLSSASVIEALSEHVEHRHVEAIESLVSDPSRGPGIESAVEYALQTLGDIPGAAEALHRLTARAQAAAARDAEIESGIAEVDERAAAANAPVSGDLLGARFVPEQMKIVEVRRFQKSVKQALLESPELEQCQRDLANAGLSIEFENGAKFFGRPDQYRAALRAIDAAHLDLKFYHIVVSLDLEETVHSVIGRLRSSDRVSIHAQDTLATMPLFSEEAQLGPVKVKSTCLHIEIPASNSSSGAPAGPAAASCPPMM